ncbi:hypothetical protein BGZ76_005162, partial [Entomortierella beljakovae]
MFAEAAADAIVIKTVLDLYRSRPGPSDEVVRLYIEVPVQERITYDSVELPAFYGSVDEPISIRPVITLEVDKECKGEELRIELIGEASFRLPVNAPMVQLDPSKETFARKRWTLPLEQSSQGIIAPGKYSNHIDLTIDPTWPSSTKTIPGGEGTGWVRYELSASIGKVKTNKQFNPTKTVTQELFIFNSCIPTKQNPLNPFVNQAEWMSSSLPVSLHLPTDILATLQVIPVTVKMGPFKPGTKFSGKDIIVVKGSLILKEKTTGFCEEFNGDESLEWGKFVGNRVVISIPIQDWPTGSGPWEKTINLSMPSFHDVSPNVKSKFLRIGHKIVLDMKVKAKGQFDIMAKQYKLE